MTSTRAASSRAAVLEFGAGSSTWTRAHKNRVKEVDLSTPYHRRLRARLARCASARVAPEVLHVASAVRDLLQRVIDTPSVPAYWRVEGMEPRCRFRPRVARDDDALPRRPTYLSSRYPGARACSRRARQLEENGATLVLRDAAGRGVAWSPSVPEEDAAGANVSEITRLGQSIFGLEHPDRPTSRRSSPPSSGRRPPSASRAPTSTPITPEIGARRADCG